MLDPITTPLLVYVLGNLAHEVIAAACKDHLKDKLKRVFGLLEELGEKDKVELAYQDTMEQAYGSCLELLLVNIKGCGYSNEELKQYETSLKAFINDDEVADQLLTAVREPTRNDLPSHVALANRWHELGGQELPSETLWSTVAAAFRRQATKQIILSDDLRDLLNAQNLQQLKELIERQGGVKVQVRRDKYSQRMRTKFSPVDLANLMPAYADDPGRMVIRDVFVPQNVRENPPPVEIPKDLAERLRKGERPKAGDSAREDLDEQQLEKLRTSYVSQSAKPVLDVITAAGKRLSVLTGEPGSGKSTLMRYLLTGILEPPLDRESGELLAWTAAFNDTFPLLIELRDFHALRRMGKCDSFLKYVDYMGKTDQWFLDDHAVNEYLEASPSLVMFDGLDEIFDTADRDRVMQEIAGFAQRYPKARIIVTSRPFGYKEQVLREAGFAHFRVQDLGDEQIQAFIRGWFALTFPQQMQQAEQRIERLLRAVLQSKPVRLLAGNPMLLTIMALLAREEELPRERAKFYEKAVEVLCHHWDANRNLVLHEDRYLSADDKKELLRRIAMRMQAGEAGLKGNVIMEDDLENEVKQWFMDRFGLPEHEAIKAARTMIKQLRERNYILCLRGPHLYGFVHRTFLEFLTAADVVRQFNITQTLDEQGLIDLLDRHCRDDDWREVLRLICGQIDEQFVGRIVAHLTTRTDLKKWDGKTPLPELPLAIWCLSEVRNLRNTTHEGNVLLGTAIQFLAGCDGEIPAEDSNQYSHGELHDFLEDQLLPSIEALGDRWPGAETLAPRAVGLVDHLTGGGQIFWSRFVAALCNERAVIHALADCGRFLVRQGAVRVLAAKWADDDTYRLLRTMAENDVNGYPRLAAIRALADLGEDQDTRDVIVKCCSEDSLFWVRGGALRVLVAVWPDVTTRKLLEERAVKDQDVGVSQTALEMLAEKWPDQDTRKLLEARARVDGVAASLYGARHSSFGRIVFTGEAVGYGPYLDPTKPISRGHIERAAEGANVPADKIDETVRSLSEHMRWDITKGSGK